MLDWYTIQGNALVFSRQWKDFQGLEKQSGQQFVTELLACFGLQANEVGEFELKVGNSWMDYFWPKKLGVEMKSPGNSLSEAKKQLSNYVKLLDPELVPQLLLVSDFLNIHLYNLVTKKWYEFKTSNLRKHINKFIDLIEDKTKNVNEDQEEVNVKAAEKMAKLHDALKSHGYDGHELEVYLVRLLFCLFAEDTGIFCKDLFRDYIEQSKANGSDLSDRISILFQVLNLPKNSTKRKFLSEELKQFCYVNGSLFKTLLSSAVFNQKMRSILLDCCNFDWSAISPAIFGAIFQGVMSREQRREIGAHYTSEENILKVIKPLFLDELWNEFEEVKLIDRKLTAFHEKISRLKFLDPACGCGNFLIITYRELRCLEFEILKIKCKEQALFDSKGMLKVSINQFYGIEIEDFPCQIFLVGMLLMEHQMNMTVSDYFGKPVINLPLEESANVFYGNALRVDWGIVVPKGELSYILGNPPFNGARTMLSKQKEDMGVVFGELKGFGNLDYVTAWFKKAADLMKGTNIRCGFVSTNSIVQGEQPAILWKALMRMGVHINFGVPTFKWSNDASGKAAVHCVIVGFSYLKTEPIINQYLIKAPIVFIESRQQPICRVPDMVFGNMANDGGNLILSAEEYEEFFKKEPKAKKYIRRFMGAEEFINNIPRYCLWLVGVEPSELRKMPLVKSRLEGVRKNRRASKSEGTRKLADVTMLFGEIRQPYK
jgi:type II restriction/modification system DNA methylase subunit YeeA